MWDILKWLKVKENFRKFIVLGDTPGQSTDWDKELELVMKYVIEGNT